GRRRSGVLARQRRGRARDDRPLGRRLRHGRHDVLLRRLSLRDRRAPDDEPRSPHGGRGSALPSHFRFRIRLISPRGGGCEAGGGGGGAAEGGGGGRGGAGPSTPARSSSASESTESSSSTSSSIISSNSPEGTAGAATGSSTSASSSASSPSAAASSAGGSELRIARASSGVKSAVCSESSSPMPSSGRAPS